jgi:hypothetical protein
MGGSGQRPDPPILESVRSALVGVRLNRPGGSKIAPSSASACCTGTMMRHHTHQSSDRRSVSRKADHTGTPDWSKIRCASACAAPTSARSAGVPRRSCSTVQAARSFVGMPSGETRLSVGIGARRAHPTRLVVSRTNHLHPALIILRSAIGIKDFAKFLKVFPKCFLHRWVTQPRGRMDSKEILFTVSFYDLSVLFHDRNLFV